MRSNRLKPEDVPKLIQDLQREGTFGELSIRFRRGQIMSVALTETYLTERQFTGENQNNDRNNNRS